MPKSKLEWALHLRDLGLQVFPLVHTDKEGNCSCGDPACKKRNRGKHPKKGSQGFKDATTDANVIKAMWAEDPDANIGVWAGPDKVWVDLDTKGETSGLSTLAEFLKVDTFDLTDQTFAVRTPSGGIHMYYTTDVPVGDRVGVLPNVDIRGQGGYVVGPGSTIGDKTYTVITDRKIMPVPEGIQTVLRHIRERDSQAQVELFELDTKASINRAIDYLKRRPPAVEGEGGNEHTYVTALQVRDLGISEEKAVELMLEHWNDRCDPPWDHDEIKVPIHNAFRYAKDRPGNKGQGIPDDFDDSEYYTKDSDAGEDVDRFAKFRKNFFYSGNQVSEYDQVYEFIIPGWVPAQGYSICNGKRGTGKSTFLIDMCGRISCDMDWHGVRIDKGWTVVYLAAEDFLGVKQRMEAWRKKYLDNKPWPNDRFKVLNMAIDLCNAEDVALFTEFLNDMFKDERVLFIIDTWQRSVISAKGQNDDASMSLAIHNMESMAKTLRGPSILATHPPKGNEETVLGSSVIENASQAIWQLSNYNNARSAEVVRIKGCPDGSKVRFRFLTIEMDGIDNLGNKLNGPCMEMMGGSGMEPTKALKESDLKMATFIANVIKGIKDFDPNISKPPSVSVVAEVIFKAAEQIDTNETAKRWNDAFKDVTNGFALPKKTPGRIADKKIFKTIANLIPVNDVGIPTNNKNEWIKRTDREIVVYVKQSLMDLEDEQIDPETGEISMEDVDI